MSVRSNHKLRLLLDEQTVKEFFGPFVSAFIDVTKDRVDDDTIIDSFSWSLGLLFCTFAIFVLATPPFPE